MSTRLSSRCCWRKCQFRRLYSSSAAETNQQPRRAPIASDLGGIQIGPFNSRFSRQGRRSDTKLDLRDFKQGTLSRNLAVRELRQHQNIPQPITQSRPAPSQSDSSRTTRTDSTQLSHQKDDTKARPRQQQQTTDIRQPRYPAQQGVRMQSARTQGARTQGARMQGARMQRRSRPMQHESDKDELLELYEEEETDAIDDDVHATKTTFQLRSPDPPLAPPKPPLPPSLTTLAQKIYVDTPTHQLLEKQGGDYIRYFSPKEWKIARAQSSAPLDVVDYARLALHLNQTVPVTKRSEGVEIVRKYVQKVIPSPPP